MPFCSTNFNFGGFFSVILTLVPFRFHEFNIASRLVSFMCRYTTGFYH